MENMIAQIKPDFHFRELPSIPLTIFNKKKLVILDLDNTLVLPEKTETKKKIIKFVKQLNKKYKVVIYSNSSSVKKRKKALVKIFNSQVEFGFGRKPFKKSLMKLMEKYCVKGSDTVVIGDRLLTDILWGNRNKTTTILIDPLNPKKEQLYIQIARKIERIFLKE